MHAATRCCERCCERCCGGTVGTCPRLELLHRRNQPGDTLTNSLAYYLARPGSNSVAWRSDLTTASAGTLTRVLLAAGGRGGSTTWGPRPNGSSASTIAERGGGAARPEVSPTRATPLLRQQLYHRARLPRVSQCGAAQAQVCRRGFLNRMATAVSSQLSLMSAQYRRYIKHHYCCCVL